MPYPCRTASHTDLPLPAPSTDAILVDTDESSFSSLDLDTTSLRPSVLRYKWENGRRYHAYGDGAYWGPNDERQQDAEDMMHELYRIILDGKLYEVPLQSDVKTVLDVGCGTGIWAMEFADKHPSAEVIGVDLSPIQPAMVPPNCRFEVDDINNEWIFPGNHFDFVHVRVMTGCVPDWIEFHTKALKHLKPGGWVQQIELSCIAKSDDGTINEDSPLVTWRDVFTEMGEAYGNTFFACEQASNAIKEAGFVNVSERRVKLPIGKWPKDNQLKLWGAWNQQYLIQGLEGFSIRGLTDLMKWSYLEVQVLLAQMRKELLDPKVHAYIEMCIIGAQKPEQD